MRNRSRAEPSHAELTQAKSALVIGDSILRDFDPDKSEHGIYLFSYPGITWAELGFELLHEFLPPPNQIDVVILHCGTNNVSRSRRQQSIPSALKDLKACLEVTCKMYPDAKLYLSGILPRLDSDQYRAELMNKECAHFASKIIGPSLFSNVQFIDLSDLFMKGSSVSRSFYRNVDCPDDKVHLSSRGHDLLFDAFCHLIRVAISCRPRPRSPPMNLVEWNQWRQESFGRFQLRNRYRITNYAPAITRETFSAPCVAFFNMGSKGSKPTQSQYKSGSEVAKVDKSELDRRKALEEDYDVLFSFQKLDEFDELEKIDSSSIFIK